MMSWQLCTAMLLLRFLLVVLPSRNHFTITSRSEDEPGPVANGNGISKPQYNNSELVLGGLILFFKDADRSVTYR